MAERVLGGEGVGKGWGERGWGRCCGWGGEMKGEVDVIAAGLGYCGRGGR